MFDTAAIFLVVTALLAYVNDRFVGLPSTIGVMATSMALTLLLIGLDWLGITSSLRGYEESLLSSVDFSELLMQGMLSFLLFAGALHLDLNELRAYRWQIGGLALLGTLLSTLLVGFGLWLALPLAGWQLPLIYCLLFGALISPTDPIAVMGILKSAGAPKNLELVIAGESLFNDGIGVVIFTLLVAVLVSGVPPTLGEGARLLMHEAGGGLVFGLALGYLTLVLLRSLDNYRIEVMITLAAVAGGYALASKLHVSGPLAMVVAGLVVGNQGRAIAMSDTTRRYLDMFWEMVDEMLNAVLFVVLGMEVLAIDVKSGLLLAAGIALGTTLLARLLAVGLPVRLLHGTINLPHGSWQVLTWGGLRGGISVALALSLPQGPARAMILGLTYSVVVFSVLVQGLSVGWVSRRAMAGNSTD